MVEDQFSVPALVHRASSCGSEVPGLIMLLVLCLESLVLSQFKARARLQVSIEALASCSDRKHLCNSPISLIVS
jgi:hypothetical protein